MFLASCPPSLEGDYHGPGSGPDIGLIPQLVWQAWLSSHLGSHQLSTHRYMQHYAAGSFPGRDCKMLITCLTTWHTQENVRRRHRCLASCTNIQSGLFRCEQNFQRTNTHTKAIRAHKHTSAQTRDHYERVRGGCASYRSDREVQ